MLNILLGTFSELVYTVVIAAYLITVLGTVGVVVSENRNPVRSLAWMTVLLLLPVAGIVLYAFFGRSLKSKALISRKNKRKLRKKEAYAHIDESKLSLSEESKQEIRLAHSLVGAHYYPGNRIEIFTNGKDKFDALKKDIAEAHDYINIQYYIFEDDALGQELKSLLIGKRKEGVKVRVIYDHVGSFHVKRKFFKEMRQAGIEVGPFLKVTFPRFATRINWRNHRKILVIDGKVGYIGGMNIADRYLDGGVEFNCWRDTHLRIEGPLLNSMQYSFAVDWNFMGNELIETTPPKCAAAEDDDAGAQLMTSGPNEQWSNISFLFLKAIANAKKCVYIQSPYFLPTESLIKVLQTAALSKVDVRVMIPLKSDSAILTKASRSYVTECLRAGIKVYFYNAGMLHAKTVIVDDEFTTTGSTNFDFRSFEHNFEANVFIYSKQVNERMKQIFLDDMQHCHRVVAHEWRNRPLFERAKESTIRLLSPVL